MNVHNFKYAIVTLLALLAGQSAWAGDTFYFKAIATASPTGSGTVYVSDASTAENKRTYKASSEKESSESSYGSAASKDFYYYAKPNDGYTFVNWTEDGKPISTSPDYKTSKSSSSTDSNNPLTFTLTANFAKTGLIVVASSNSSIGSASIDNVSNDIGDVVTLTATPQNRLVTFKGWRKNSSSDFFSTEPVVQLTVGEDTRGTYTAVFEAVDLKKGVYCAVYNVSTDKGTYGYDLHGHLGIMGISDNCSRTNRYTNNSLMLSGGDAMHASPAFVVKVTGTYTSGNISSADFSSQGKSVNAVTNSSITIRNVADYHIFYINLFGVSGYIVDYHDAKTHEEIFGQVNHPGGYNGSEESFKDQQYQWKIVPLTEYGKEEYFGAMPAEKTMQDGKYYTTMYTAFPYRCLDGVKAFVVDEIRTDGTIHLSEIADGIVPSKTAVVLECNDTKPVNNRLLPLVDEPAALGVTNLLRGEIWLKDYTKTEDKYRTKFDADKMRVLSNEECAFVNHNNTALIKTGDKTSGQGVLTYIQNNTCYLDVSGVSEPLDSYTLDFSVPIPEVTEGYYRVESTEGGTLQVTGDSETTVTDADAATLAGTVIKINFANREQGKEGGYTLHAQGVDVAESPVAVTYENTTGGRDVYRADLGSGEALWHFTPIDEASNAFLAQSEATVDGKHYGTLCVDFNYRPGIGVEAYAVTRVLADGTATLQRVTGDVMPAGTPLVLAWADGVTPTIMPTNDEAVTVETNLLLHAEDYFVHGNNDGWKGLESGTAHFATQSEQVDGNRAYAVTPQALTLADIVAEGEVGKTYEVADEAGLLAAYFDSDKSVIYAKDDNGYAAKDVRPDGVRDYVRSMGLMNRDYDQSNWVALALPRVLTTGDNDLPTNRRLHHVVGTLTDKENPAMTLSYMPEGDDLGITEVYTPNVYLPANFVDDPEADNGEQYYFVTPKPQEIATVQWAVYDYKATHETLFGIPVIKVEHTYFVTPQRDVENGVNMDGLHGGFVAGNAMFTGNDNRGNNERFLFTSSENQKNFNDSEDQNAHHSMFTLLALVKKAPEAGTGQGAPRRGNININEGDPIGTRFVVEPIEAHKLGDDVITAIESLPTDKIVTGVTYYNVAGQVAAAPFKGVNIVVVTYSDGTRAIAKVIK